MRKSTLLMLAVFASLLAAGGCKATASDVTGAGFEVLTLSQATRAFVVANDLSFARQIASHNRTCRQMAGCAK
ncbi:nicotinamidase-related amidase [Mycoplana sp. BE70]|uniref:hypothetical protein n=1 Tax=Mycoplana sp. BE70 TaxID=2817775 RepID=UPI00285A9822|nr:hypothetical protein [Mycoplana sp. BE70]MDR6757851.1 nicotinamidase-related amidase [Mycoplana sp. BE70]